MAAVGAIVAISAIIAWPIFHNDYASPVSLVWSSYDGIEWQSQDRSHRSVWTPMSKGGYQLRCPSFVLHRGGIVYLSPEDKALCVIDRKGKRTSLSLPHFVPEPLGLNDLQPTPRGVIVTELKSYPGVKRVKSLDVDLSAGSTTVMKSDYEVRSKPNSENIAVVVTGGHVEITGKKTQSVIKLPPSAWDWDCDPGRGTIAYTDGWHCTLVDAGQTFTWSVPYVLTVSCVSLQPSIRQLWVSADPTLMFGFPFFPHHVLLAYSYTGEYLGCIVRADEAISRPIVADGQDLELLREISTTAKRSS